MYKKYSQVLKYGHKIKVSRLRFIFMAPTKSDQPSTSAALGTRTFWNIYWPFRCKHDWAAGITSIIHRHECTVWHLHEAVTTETNFLHTALWITTERIFLRIILLFAKDSGFSAEPRTDLWYLRLFFALYVQQNLFESLSSWFNDVRLDEEETVVQKLKTQYIK